MYSNDHFPFAVRPLPYPAKSLMPYLNARTLKIHHDWHYAIHVEKLNKILECFPRYRNLPLDALILKQAFLPEEIRSGVKLHASGALAHMLFFECLTSPSKSRMSDEFKKVLEQSGNDGIILSYPDKAFGKKDEWKKSKDDIIKDLTKIIRYKDWDLIVTHNKEGEYGHIHHKMTHRFVTDIYDKVSPGCDLYFFGKYYTKSKIGGVEDQLTRISDEQLEYKERLEKLYKSQSKVVDMFCQMNPYEEWTCYNEQGE